MPYSLFMKNTADTALTFAELNLDKAQQGRSYLITSNAATGRDRMRMDCLGLMPGELTHVLFSNFSGLVVAVKGSRLALGKPLAKRLTVREFLGSDWLDHEQA